jgi:hypothetical protein
VEPHAKRPVKIDIGHVQVCDLLDPSPTVIEEHQERSIAKGERAISWQRLEDRIDLFAFQIKRVRSLSSLGGNSLYSLSFSQHLWVTNSEIAIERMKGSEPLVACTDFISARAFNHAQEFQDSFRSQIGKF